MRVITNKIKAWHQGDHGESNGYLVIDDKNHPWFGKEFDEIDIEVHGRLTFSSEVTEELISLYKELTSEDIGSWIIGFDTAHLYDTYDQWPDKEVRIHAELYLLKTDDREFYKEFTLDPALELSK